MTTQNSTLEDYKLDFEELPDNKAKAEARVRQQAFINQKHAENREKLSNIISNNPVRKYLSALVEVILA